MATVLATAFLPPAKDAGDDAPPPDDDSSGRGDDDDQQATIGLGSLGSTRQAPKKQRTRPLAVNVSLSQLASEQNPVLSVTFGWAGKDQLLTL